MNICKTTGLECAACNPGPCEHRTQLQNVCQNTECHYNTGAECEAAEGCGGYEGAGKWIPVSERLPEEKENPITKDWYVYPVIYKQGDVTDIRYYGYGNGHWWHGPGIMDDRVIAWMPLPKPYREDEEVLRGDKDA